MVAAENATSQSQKPLTFTRSDQNTGGALFEFFMRTAMHGTSCVSSAISICHNKISPHSLTGGVAQSVRRWTRDHRVMQSVGSSPTETLTRTVLVIICISILC